MVGGKFGRFHREGTELFREADKETLMDALEATIQTIKDESIGHEDITSIVNRIGVAPIFQRLYGNGRDTKAAKKAKPPQVLAQAKPSGGATCEHCQ